MYKICKLLSAVFLAANVFQNHLVLSFLSVIIVCNKITDKKSNCKYTHSNVKLEMYFIFLNTKLIIY